MSKKEELAVMTFEEKATGKVLLNYKALEPELRKKVSSIALNVQNAMVGFVKSSLMIGQFLSEARLLLQARGERVFVAFVNGIPGMSQPTAYRYVQMYENAKEVYPENILSAVLASGLPLIGPQDRRFGKYTEIIEKKKLLPPKDATPAQAREWIETIQLEYKNSTRSHKAKTVDLSVLQEEAFRAVVRRWDKLPKEKRNVAWLRTLFSCIVGYIGVEAKFQIESKQPPIEWLEGTTVGKAKEETAKKLQKESDEAGQEV